MSDKPIGYDEAFPFVHALFLQAKCSDENARAVTQALIKAEADGLKGHGFSRIPSYLAQSLCGKVDGFAIPHHRFITNAMHAVDANSGFAYPALNLSLAIAAQYIPQSGVLCIGISRSHHAGACGHVVENLARQGYVAMMFANTPAAIAPFGGNRGVFGTNPIAFATPVQGKDPVVVDLALSKVARGSIVAAAQKGETIPDDWALDEDGQKTTDANKALKGTMLPLGDAKGTALAFMVEVLAAGLTGSHFAGQASSFLDERGVAPHTGQLLIVIDPKRFHGGYLDHLASLIGDIEAQSGARLSGYRRYALREKAKSKGFVLGAAMLREVELLGLKI